VSADDIDESVILTFDNPPVEPYIDFTLFSIDGFPAQGASYNDPGPNDIRLVQTGGDWLPSLGRTWTADPDFYAGYPGGSGSVGP